ncbi:MAG: 2-oxoacid:acceptor oxidoreductase family protein [Holophagales bacterium]|jgi:2-oxoglutarate ferredoxin oxidoreductase subunit gamma|nr:2-oxoacid:acceptor oxidoreductase family protein [Holophagales bacterium]
MAKTEIRIGGLGGQGVILCASIIGKAASIFEGKHATLIQAFGPEARGSACSAQVSVSDSVIGYPYVTSLDMLAVMSQDAFNLFAPTIKPNGILLYEEELVKLNDRLPDSVRRYSIPATRFAEELGRRLVLNIVMVGFFAGVTKLCSFEAFRSAAMDSVPKGTEDLNLKALQKGYDYGVNYSQQP